MEGHRAFQMEEAIHSIALSHPEGCGCVTCRAADGDEDARATVMVMLIVGEAERRAGS